MVERKIRGVRKYQLLSNSLFYINLEEGLFKEETMLLENIFGLESSSGFVMAYRKEPAYIKTFLINELKTREIDLSINASLTNENDTLLKSNYDLSDSSFEYEQFDYLENRSIKKLNSRLSLLHPIRLENDIYHFDKERLIISKFHLPTETTLWQYDTSVLGIEKIGKILGVFGEVLVVGIRIGLNDSGLIALNINNGQLVWQQMFSKSGLGLNLSHSTEHNTLISLGAFNIWEFDLKEKKVIRDKDLSEKLVHNDKPFKISSATLDHGKFYFVAHYVGQSMSSALLGIFNTETEELKWIHDFEGKVHLGGNARPKVGGNKIYTLDNGNTLHIFERVL